MNKIRFVPDNVRRHARRLCSYYHEEFRMVSYLQNKFHYVLGMLTLQLKWFFPFMALIVNKVGSSEKCSIIIGYYFFLSGTFPLGWVEIIARLLRFQFHWFHCKDYSKQQPCWLLYLLLFHTTERLRHGHQPDWNDYLVLLLAVFPRTGSNRLEVQSVARLPASSHFLE